MFRGNLQHTGVYNAPGVPKLTGIKRRFHTAGRVISSPAAVDGILYVGSTDTNLYALDAATGALKWKSTREAGSPRLWPSPSSSCTSSATTASSTPSTLSPAN